jgi:hypothetical protein
MKKKRRRSTLTRSLVTSGHLNLEAAGSVPTICRTRGLPAELEVDLYIAPRLRTADQQITAGRRLEGIRLIVNLASDQGAFAGVADARAAGPPYGNIAGFGEFQQASERCGPWNG